MEAIASQKVNNKNLDKKEELLNKDNKLKRIKKDKKKIKKRKKLN